MSKAADMAPSAVFSIPALHDLNRRVIDFLAQAARHRTDHPLSMVSVVKRELLASTPESRDRAAARSFLLLDLDFHNAPWWQSIAHHPERRIRKPTLQPAFPRETALPLTRATLIAAWRAVSADARAARIALGLEASVVDLLVTLPVTAIDPIGERVHPYLRPRWADHPAFWRALLRAANKEDSEKLSRIDVQGIQLLTGNLLIASAQQKIRRAARDPSSRQSSFPSGKSTDVFPR
jgi:hypothetical protein